MHSLRGSQGMSLMEILIALAIVAVLALVAVPSFNTYLVNNRLRGAAEALYHDFHKARTAAMKRGVVVQVVFQTGSTWCYGLGTGACNCSVPSTCDLGAVSSDAYRDTTLSISGFTTAPGVGDTAFSSARGSVSRTGTATFTVSGGGTISVNLNQLGFPQICSNDVGGYNACP